MTFLESPFQQNVIKSRKNAASCFQGDNRTVRLIFAIVIWSTVKYYYRVTVTEPFYTPTFDSHFI